jgi:hypothetical protein
VIHVAVRVDHPSKAFGTDPKRCQCRQNELWDVIGTAGVNQQHAVGRDQQRQADGPASDFALQEVDPFEDLLD